MNILFQIVEILFWFVIIIVPLVVIHEFGHFLMARIFGVKIPEFAVGMPIVKRTFSKRFKGVIWSFYWPIFGGFVRIFGDNDAADRAFEENKQDPKLAEENYVINRYQEIFANQELRFYLEDNNLEYDDSWKVFEKSKYRLSDKLVDEEKVKNTELESKYKQLETLIKWEFETVLKSKNTFFAKNWIQQTLIILGGITFNLIFAVLVYWFIFSALPVNNSSVNLDEIARVKDDVAFTQKSKEVTLYIVKDSLASKAGLVSGDKLTNFAGTSSENIESLDDFKNVLQKYKGEEVVVQYINKDNQSKEVKVKLEEKNGKLLFGVGNLKRNVSYTTKNLFSGLSLGVKTTWNTFKLTGDLLGKVFMALLPNSPDRQILEGVGGPLVIGAVGGTIFKTLGVSGILNVMAALSVQLAILNLLPIPALDGGRWVILTLNKIFGKRNRRIEATIIGVTYLLLMALSIFLLFRDVFDISSGKYNF